MTHDTRPLALIVAGPTASGKSALAADLAEAFDGTVINADALQVYRELSVLSARPTESEMGRVPHRLYGVLSASEGCSAGRWRGMALQEMEAARSSGRLPILVGGTGLYLKALEEGIAAVPEVPGELRAEAERRLAAGEREKLWAELAAGDPISHSRLHPNDSQRLLRAWEVLKATGRPLPEWQEEKAVTPAPWRFAWLLLLPAREDLNRTIATRFKSMVAGGAMEEVRTLLTLGLPLSATAMKAVGVKELAACLRGELSLEEAIEAGSVATRRYAKRQMTWLRGQVARRKRTLIEIGEQYSEMSKPVAFSKIRRYVLTLPR